MILTPELLPEALMRQLPSVMLCFGEEPERLGQSIDLIWQAAQQRGFNEKQVLIVESVSDWADMVFTYQEQSLFSTQRMLLVHLNIKFSASQSEQWQQLLLNPNPDIFLVIRAGALDKQAQEAKWVKSISAAKGWLLNSRDLEGRALIDWLHKMANQLGMTITPDAVQILADWSEGNLLASRQSLHRWQLQGITTVDQSLLMQDQQDWARFDVFALIDAITRLDVVQSVRIFDRLKDEGEDLILILWALSKEVRLWKTLILALAQKPWGQVVSEQRIWRDKADRLRSICTKIQITQLETWLGQLFLIDKMIKGQSQGSPEMALKWLLVDMASLGKLNARI